MRRYTEFVFRNEQAMDISSCCCRSIVYVESIDIVCHIRLSAPHRVHLASCYSDTMHEHYVDSVKCCAENIVVSKVRLLRVKCDSLSTLLFLSSRQIMSIVYGNSMCREENRTFSFVGIERKSPILSLMFDLACQLHVK
jgi:hypothetical protein